MDEPIARIGRPDPQGREALVEPEIASSDRGEPDNSTTNVDATNVLTPETLSDIFRRGRICFEQGDYDSAIRDFDTILEKAPTNAVILGLRATARHNSGDFGGSVADYDRAIAIGPQLGWMYKGRGTALHFLEDYDAAIADYTCAINIDPADADTYCRRGSAHCTVDDFDAAISDLTESIRLAPANAEAHQYRADSLFALDDHNAAIADYDEAIRLDPNLAHAYRGRAGCWDALGRADLADADYERADRLDDEDSFKGEVMSVTERKTQLHALINSHFEPTPFEDLTITERLFPHRVRADLQRATDQMIGGEMSISFFCGVRKNHSFEGINLSELLIHDRNNPAQSVPPLYEEIDVGEEQPIRCLQNGLWLLESGGIKLALFLEQNTRFHHHEGVKIQVATANDPQGFQLSQRFLTGLEEAIRKAESYRGKILSLEAGERYRGQSAGITVHRLSNVDRDQVILPASTLELLERNVIRFVDLRSRLSNLGLATKKGLLFYGPPGTGKTHTIHYLAGALKGHTTLLVTAEQVGLLDEYMALARLLQPSIVVIEDVDLIARDRTTMGSPCEEALLNKLLNEMDGLRTDSEILFVLTTNRPEALEAALASRPGRVDQAIEFPLPDEIGRAKLVRLYARGVEVSDEVVRETVMRTEGVSASFIKELMRRAAQFQLERDGSGGLTVEDVSAALDELLFSGGTLNRKLLGARTDDAQCSV